MADTSRSTARRAFLAALGMRECRITPLAGDASRRRYFRVIDAKGCPHVLMDAPPDSGQPVAVFVQRAAIFAAAGLSVPQLRQVDAEAGFVLMEDFGDALFSTVITDRPAAAVLLYGEAVRALVRLQAEGDRDSLPARSSAERARLALPAIEDYAAAHAPAPEADRAAFLAHLERALGRFAPESGTPVHRDCHADNLVWLPEREGLARVGWLDFQDAELGHPAYDPVSLLCDARRDLPAELVAGAKARFLGESGSDPAEFEAAWAALGAQRSLRILGIFARLARQDGKRAYLAHLPRVWRQLRSHLAHPALAELREVVAAVLPEPNPSLLSTLARSCPTPPAP